MNTVSVERAYDAPVDRVRSVFEDVTAFFEAAGFDVKRDGDLLELTKRVAVARLELRVSLNDDDGTTLAYEQIAGPFEKMSTRYVLEPSPAGCRLTIVTSFEPPSSGFGSFINGAAIERQRRTELDAVGSLLESTFVSRDEAGEGRTFEAGGD